MEEESATTSTTQNLTTPSSSQFYSIGLLTPKCRLENKRCCRNVLYPWYYSYCSYDILLWRNNWVFNNETTDPQLLIHGFINMIVQYHLSPVTISRVPPANRPSSFACWQPPPSPLIKINTDAAIWTNEGIGLGWVIRDHSGSVLAAGAKKMSVHWDAQVAEFAAARYGIMKALDLGFKDVIIESDAIGVIAALQNKTTFRNGIHHFLYDIRELIPSFNCLLASHVKRGGNCLAHFMARLGPSDGSDILYQSAFPQRLIALSEADILQ